MPRPVSATVRRIAGARRRARRLGRDRDATRLRLQAVHGVGHEVLEDTPEGDRIADDARQIRGQLRRELDALARLQARDDFGDQRVQIAVAPVQSERQPLVARGQRLEIRDAGIDRLPPLGEHRRQRRRIVALDLRQMAHHVAKRDEPVLDVVIDLASQVADGGAPFGLAHARRAAAQPRGQVAEQPRQPARLRRCPRRSRTSRRSRSSTAVFSARSASGRLMRDDTHTASTSAVIPVPAAVTRNQESALRTSARSGVSGCVT